MQEDTIAMAFSIMSNRQKQKFKDNLEIDIAYSVPGLGRFRCNVFQQRGTVGLVLRVIPVKILTVRELLLPLVLEKIAEEQRGLILCTGTTGSGKSTTLAAMIDYINSQRCEHIITIEDPIEFLHRDKKSIVNQREVEVDTRSFAGRPASRPPAGPRRHPGRRDARLRDHRDRASPRPRPATSCSPPSTPSTPPRPSTASSRSSRPTSRSRSASSSPAVLKAVISLRLLPRADGQGRVPAVEVLISTPYIRDCIENKEKTKLIHDAIAAGVIAVRHADLRPVALPALQEGLITSRRRCAAPPTPTSSSSRSRASSRPPTWPARRWRARSPVRPTQDPLRDSPFDYPGQLGACVRRARLGCASMARRRSRRRDRDEERDRGGVAPPAPRAATSTTPPVRRALAPQPHRTDRLGRARSGVGLRARARGGAIGRALSAGVTARGVGASAVRRRRGSRHGRRRAPMARPARRAGPRLARVARWRGVRRGSSTTAAGLCASRTTPLEALEPARRGEATAERENRRMTADEIRAPSCDFFEERGHRVVGAARRSCPRTTPRCSSRTPG